MKKLNKKANEVFAELLDMMQGKQYMNIRFDYPNDKDSNSPFMPLTIEKLAEGIETAFGVGKIYSLCHFYIQNGDLMQDPEMCFIVIDDRTEKVKDLNLLAIFPILYVQANLGIYHESVIVVDGKATKYRKVIQSEQASFANTWLMGIKRNGYVSDKTFKKFQ
ncbi:DUF6908 domain-containing protein [Sphingobacterium yanglingense]|uniref:DUF6908 domain-containing protein n=1 Tax=Sphingobacterium yanglingense TaxID=1437280 RepID=A0A4R6W522_9SPHI|nr:hypothetical protein [Sphingobacterium yanglingense]TDQ73834.1 hypothetical protein CLV99_4271 [Sphingobacterium yanglingense]